MVQSVGLQVTDCGIQTYEGDQGELQTSDVKLCGAGGILLPVKGLTTAQNRFDNK